MKNDYDRVMAYIRQQIAVVQPAQGEERRDLEAYFDDKLALPSNTRRDVKEMAKRALRIAGLDEAFNYNVPSTLPKAPTAPADTKRYAIAAKLLAMSIIQDAQDFQLQAELQRLNKMNNETSILIELRNILTKGDIVTSIKNNRQVEYKNFKSVGASRSRYLSMLDRAFTNVDNMLNSIDTGFIMPNSRPSQKVMTAFVNFFGDPDRTINTTTLEFGAKRDFDAPTWTTAVQSHRNVVRMVLRRVFVNFAGQPIRFYFGGRAIDDGTYAYVSGKTKPTRIHLGGQFFSLAERGVDSMPGTIVHECTHTFARTRDHKYGEAGCKDLAATSQFTKALANAESYQLFVETAFT